MLLAGAPEYQRSFASNTLRGVSADASAVIAPLVAWLRDPPGTIGLTTPQVRTWTSAPAARGLPDGKTGQLTGAVSRAPIRSSTAGSSR